MRFIFKNIIKKLRFYFSVNWTKTLYFNFKIFPFAVAKQLPVYFYGRVHFQNMEGSVFIDAPIKRGMIGFGQQYESNTRSKGTAEIFIAGKVTFKGHVQFGKDYFVYVAKDAVLEMGHMSSLGSNGKIICNHKVVLGKFARIGFESQVIDSTFHQMIDTVTGHQYVMKAPINIGNYNYIGNRVSIMSKTITPDYCTISSSSFCNKDYSTLGKNVLIGGIPAKLLRENTTRDWENEVLWLIKAMT